MLVCRSRTADSNSPNAAATLHGSQFVLSVRHILVKARPTMPCIPLVYKKIKKESKNSNLDLGMVAT